MKIHSLLLSLVLTAIAAASIHCGQERRANSQQSEIDDRRTDASNTSPAGLGELDRAVASDSLNPEAFHRRAQYLIHTGDFNSALSDMNKAIQLNSRDSRYFVTLSDIYLAKGMVRNCLEALQKAELLDPSNNDALLKTAELYFILKDYENTFLYIKKAVDLDRQNPVAYFIAGYARMEKGDTSGAIRDLQTAVDQDQGYYEALVELGVIFSARRDPLAIGYFKRATDVEPNREEAYYLLAFTYQEMMELEKAIETYQKLLAINPQYKEAHYNLGYIHQVYLERFREAIGYFTEAIDIDPSYADAYYNRGYCFELSGEAANARKDYQQALSLVTNHELAIRGMNRLDALK
jgi:tetratricopeptide (TPR) repeat protein